MIILRLLLLSAFIILSFAKIIRHVPVFITSHETILTVNDSIAFNPLAIATEKEFINIIDSTTYARSKKISIVIFVEDTFCNEDVSLKDNLGSPYVQLRQDVLKKVAVYLPSVINAYGVLTTLLPPQKFSIFYVGSTKTKLQVFEGHYKYFYIFFEDIRNETRGETLRRHDLIMREVYFVIRQLAPGPVVAFYTGKRNRIERMAANQHMSGKQQQPGQIPNKLYPEGLFPEQFPEQKKVSGKRPKEQYSTGKYPDIYPTGKRPEGTYPPGKYPPGKFIQTRHPGQYPPGEFPPYTTAYPQTTDHEDRKQMFFTSATTAYEFYGLFISDESQMKEVQNRPLAIHGGDRSKNSSLSKPNVETIDFPRFKLRMTYTYDEEYWYLKEITLIDRNRTLVDEEWHDFPVEMNTTRPGISAPWGTTFVCRALNLGQLANGDTVMLMYYKIEALKANVLGGKEEVNFSENSFFCREALDGSSNQHGTFEKLKMLNERQHDRFLSAPIAAGLFVATMVLSILFYGVINMMAIRANDRYDQSDGKQLQITAET